MPFPRPQTARLTPAMAALLLSFLLALFYNHGFWSRVLGYMTTNSLHDRLVLLGLFLLLWAWISLPLQLLAFRPLLKPIAILLFLVAAAVSYFSEQYGVIVDAAMLQNVLQTDAAESRELLTPALLVHALLYALLPALLIARLPMLYPGGLKGVAGRAGVLALTLLVAATVVVGFNKEFTFLFRQHAELRSTPNPNYPLYAMTHSLRESPAPTVVHPLGTTAARPMKVGQVDAKRTVLVIVVGETARAENFSLNGYDRDTNPELAGLDIVNFRDTTACGTSTAESVPCMFSHLPHDDYSVRKAAGYENLLDILQHAGLPVWWLDNNSGCKGVCERIRQLDLTAFTQRDLCPDDECLDGILLEGMKSLLAETIGDLVVVLHQKGSHGPAYFKRAPKAYKHYLPECNAVNLQECSQQAIRNSYDNTIRYTDHILAETIHQLQALGDDTAAAMIYMSDHGESLGENGLYLHGYPYAFAPEQQVRVPFIAWLSRRNGVDAACLQEASSHPYTHDNLFHSVLGLLRVQTPEYQASLDVFAPCRGAQHPRLAKVDTHSG